MYTAHYMIWLAWKSKTIFIREALDSAGNNDDAGSLETPRAKAVFSYFISSLSTWIKHQSAQGKINSRIGEREKNPNQIQNQNQTTA